jgi:hypothetical protein
MVVERVEEVAGMVVAEEEERVPTMGERTSVVL